MGLSIRVFLLDDGGEPQRFPYARLERLLRHDAVEALPEYTGSYAPFVMAYVETVNGRFFQIAHIEYLRVKLDADGRVDEEAERRCLSLAAGSIDLSALARKPRKLIPAQHIFSRRQYQSEFCWRPTPAQKQRIVRLVKEQWRKR
jgi:hypothetical protein